MIYNAIVDFTIVTINGNPYPVFSYDPKNWQTSRYYMGDGYVPDLSKVETQMWFFYRAVMYMTIGCESIHFGQIE